MTTTNHWSTYKNNPVDWGIEFPAPLWERWDDLLAFADAVFELGRREEVFDVDERPPASARENQLFGAVVPSARVSVFGPQGIEDRRVRDCGAELLALRPDLERVPHVPALSISGPQFYDRSKPIYFTISLETDIWFPRVVGFNDDRDDIVWYDNSALAGRHTPRLNRFLAAVRDAAVALGGAWSVEVDNQRYADQVEATGILLPPPGITVDRIAAWAARICTAPRTEPEELARELGLPGTLVRRLNALALDPPLPGARDTQLMIDNGTFASLDMELADPVQLTHGDLEGRFGPGTSRPRVHAGSYHNKTFPLHVPDAPYSCAVFADFATAPAGATPVSGLSLRRRPARP